MPYSRKHNADECDKCLKKVGVANLRSIPFIYLDMNDDVHEDVSEKYGYPKGSGYRQYKVCEECYGREGMG